MSFGMPQLPDGVKYPNQTPSGPVYVDGLRGSRSVEGWDATKSTPVTGGRPDVPLLTSPDVPGSKGTGAGSTTVNTPSMKVFAANISQLLAPLQNSLNRLQNLLPIAAGGFYQGHSMRNMITGNNGDGMLQSGFETVLKKVIKAVTDTNDAILKLAKDYETADEQNKLTGAQLNRVMGDVVTDVTAVGSAGSKFGTGAQS